MARGNTTRKLMAAGTATLIAEPALAFAHQGGLGVIVGLVAGAVAYGILDDIEQRTGEQMARSAEGLRQRHGQHPGRTGKDRPTPLSRLLVGKSMREAVSIGYEEEADPVVIGEEDEASDELAETLELGDLHPHTDTVFSNRVAILGMSGAGKSNLVATLVEELGQYDAPLILFDMKPEYGPMAQQDYLLNPVRANAQNVTPQNAAALAARIMELRLQVIVDLSSYRSDAEAAFVMTELIAGVLRYQKARDNAERIPCTFLLEEAHYWLPENEAHSTIRGMKLANGQPLLGYVQQAFFHLAKVGRSFGMGLIVATQRPADVDKRLISQAEWRFLLKAMEPADLKVYRSYGLADSVAQALNPKQGEAYVIGPDGSRGVYHIRRRYSPDVAQSPGLANIRAGSSATSSPRSRSPIGGDFEQVNRGENVPQVNTVNGVNGPVERVNSSAWPGERSPWPVNGVNAPEPMEEAEGYTPDEEMQVVLAYAELRAAGSEPTRRAILAYLEEHHNWNRKHYTRIIKPVCDKRRLATSES